MADEQEEPSRKRVCLDNECPLDLTVSKDAKEDENSIRDEKKKEEEEVVGIVRVTFERKPEEVGMTEFLGQHAGFSGIVKNRWEDFHVHEVNSKGEVVKLTSMEIPDDDKKKMEVDEAVLTTEMREGLDAVVDGRSELFSIPAPALKEARTQLHVAIKAVYPGLTSNTVGDADARAIHVCLKKKAAGPVRSDERRVCRFVLAKKGRDTGEAISVLAGLLKSHPRKFAFAGNKDRRAVTSQQMTASGISAAKLKAINPSLRGMRLGNFQYVKRALQLGDLTGNRFSLAVREVKASDADVSAALQSLQENGFINYFGLQRFGTGVIPSHDIGLAILRQDWTRAVDLILTPQPTDLPAVRRLKRAFHETQDAAAALPGMSDHVCRSLLHGVQRHGKSLKALLELPRHLRQLYIHSTQSLLWNRLASRRVREWGARVRVGDLVVRRECREQRVKGKAAVEEVREETAAGVSIYDLVLPLPGFDVSFGGGQLRQWYRELLREMDVSEEEFLHDVRDFAAPGTYRPIFVRPSDLTFHTRLYDDPEQSLIFSDLELLCNPDWRTAPPGTDGKQKAVVVNFTLPKSCYATVAMREAMREIVIKK